MNIQEIKRRLYTLAVAGVNILMQEILVDGMWRQYYNPYIRIPFWTKGHWYIMTLYVVVLMFFTHIYGGLKIGYQKPFDVMLSQIVAIICANTVFYVEVVLLAYKFLPITPIMVVTGINICLVLVWTEASMKLYRKLFPPHRVLLVYGREKEEEARKKIIERKDKFSVMEGINAETELGQIWEKISVYNTVLLWDVPNYIRNDILKECYGRRIRIYTMPSISDILLSGSEIMHFFDTPLFLIRSNALTVDQMVIKRIIDIVIAVLLLFLTSPIMLITAVVIKFYDGGPILYRQIRCSLFGKSFYIYKFRSMKVDAEKDGVARLAQKKDSRITPIGAFIRKVRIDELPQLFNVIKGDMSFVGPRPERPEIIEEYKEQLPEFPYRMKVKAGLTGYAQIYGKYNTVPYDKLKLDLYYIEHYSLWLDLKLLLLTIKIVLTPESTEGV